MKGNSKHISGQRFGRLTAIKKVGVYSNANTSNRNISRWECICDCGNTTTVLLNGLTSGSTTSCGCYQKEMYAARSKNPFLYDKMKNKNKLFNRIYMTYMKNAANRGLAFDLDVDYFEKLTKMDCFYCGGEPKSVSKAKTVKGEYIYNGIDRLDSKEGYTADNVVTCCGDCNFMKKNMMEGQFINQVIAIYNHSVLGETHKLHGEMRFCGML